MKWKKVKLEDIFEINRGGSPRPIQDYLTEEEGGVNWIMISDASNSSKYIKTIKRKITKDGVYKSRMVYPGDLLLTNSMSFGRPYIMQNTGCIHDGWLVLRKKSEDLNLDFFYYLLGSSFIYSEFKNLASGAIVKNLNINLVKSVQIPFPPLKDQIRIATILTRAENLIAKRKASIKALDELLKSTFLEMFGDPVKNEKGWATLKGIDYADLVTVGVVVKPASYYVEEGVKALRSLNIKPNHIDLKNLVYFTEKANRGVLSKSILKKNDVVVVRTGLTGTAAVVPPELDGSNCIDLILVRTKKNILNPFYLVFLLNSERGKKLVSSKEVGGIQKHFNIGAINKIAFPIPPILFQNKFAEIVKKVKIIKNHYIQSLTEIENLYNSLSQRAFKGDFNLNKTPLRNKK